MNPDGIDLIDELLDALENAEKCVADMPRLAEEMAEAERRYHVKYAEETMRLRDEQHMPVTLIPGIVKGDEEISNLDFKRTTTKAKYDANREAVSFWKNKANALREQITREWTREDDRF